MYFCLSGVFSPSCWCVWRECVVKNFSFEVQAKHLFTLFCLCLFHSAVLSSRLYFPLIHFSSFHSFHRIFYFWIIRAKHQNYISSELKSKSVIQQDMTKYWRLGGTKCLKPINVGIVGVYGLACGHYDIIIKPSFLGL